MSLFIDFSELHRPDTPNTYLMAPEGLCQQAEPDLVAPIIRKSPAALYHRLVGMVEQRRNWAELETDADNLRLVFVARTSLLRFKDDIDIHVLPVAGQGADEIGAQLAIYSRSRIGYSDLGANAKRVAALLVSFPT
jgi:hypothetical protein